MTVLVSTGAGFLPLDFFGKNMPAWRHQQDMTIHQPEAQRRTSGPPLDVPSWRRLRLLEAGFPAALADAVASDPRLDLHALLQLIDRGCPPDLAVRILAPLPRDVTA